MAGACCRNSIQRQCKHGGGRPEQTQWRNCVCLPYALVMMRAATAAAAASSRQRQGNIERQQQAAAAAAAAAAAKARACKIRAREPTRRQPVIQSASRHPGSVSQTLTRTRTRTHKAARPSGLATPNRHAIRADPRLVIIKHVKKHPISRCHPKSTTLL